MSFWTTSEGKSAATEATGKFEASASYELIPDGTTAMAIITKPSIEQFQGDEYINIEWTVVKPDAFKNRKIFQKVRVWDNNVKKADKAKAMLANIDKNAGGKLAKLDKDPTNETLSVLTGKTMLIKILIWSIDEKTGNYIGAVSPRSTEEPAPAPAPKVVAAPVDDVFDDADVPF
jgi:hypothetical protein